MLPPFIKYHCFLRGRPVVAPTDLIVIPNLSSVGEDIILLFIKYHCVLFGTPRTSSPTDLIVISNLSSVGEDIILPLFKISLRFVRTTGGRPYGFNRYPKFIVCRGGYYPPVVCKYHCVLRGRRWSPLRICSILSIYTPPL